MNQSNQKNKENHSSDNRASEGFATVLQVKPQRRKDAKEYEKYLCSFSYSCIRGKNVAKTKIGFAEHQPKLWRTVLVS
jgi:hypothetical protein